MPSYGDFGAGAFLEGRRLALEKQKEDRMSLESGVERRERETNIAKQKMAMDAAREQAASRAILNRVGTLDKVMKSGNPQAFGIAREQVMNELMPSLQQNAPQLATQLEMVMADPTEDNFLAFSNRLRNQINSAADPKGYYDRDVEIANIVGTLAKNDTLRNPEFAKQDPRWSEAEEIWEQRRKEAAKSGADKSSITIPMGHITNHMEQIDKANKDIKMVGDLRQAGDASKFLGYKNLWTHKWREIKDKAGELPLVGEFLDNMSPTERQEYRNAAKFYSIVQGYRAQEFKALIGGAQTATEVENLVDSILNKDMSPEQFKANLERLDTISRRAREYSMMVLKNPGMVYGSEEYGRKMDEMFASADKDEEQRKRFLREKGLVK